MKESRSLLRGQWARHEPKALLVSWIQSQMRWWVVYRIVCTHCAERQGDGNEQNAQLEFAQQ